MVKILKTDSEYKNALEELQQLIASDPDSNTPDGEQLELLTLLVEEYEARAYPFDNPDPINALLFRMEQQGLTQSDLVPLLGSPTIVTEVLTRKRPLTLDMIRVLHAELGLPAHVLIQEYTAT